MAPKPPILRLRHVTVQPEFVLDYGDHLDDVPHQPITIPAKDWPTYSGERFPAEVQAWQERINNGEGIPA